LRPGLLPYLKKELLVLESQQEQKNLLHLLTLLMLETLTTPHHQKKPAQHQVRLECFPE
jgi:hypothetical protein